MARNYRARATRYYNAGRTYYGRGRTYYGRARSYGRRYQKGAVKLSVGQEWMAGFAVGMTNYDDKIPTELKLAVASAPVRGHLAGKAKAFSQGMIAGNLAQHYLNFRTGTSATTSGEGL